MPSDSLSLAQFNKLAGLNVSRETFDRLQRFVELFQKWSKVINLAAPSTLDQIWHRHVIDSAQLFKFAKPDQHWVDLGSGGGFPGVITAILLAEAGGGWVDLVESNQKKASFLRNALLETGGLGRVHPIRIEEAPSALKHCDVLSARALADLDKLFDYGYPWVESGEKVKFLLHKGRDYESEVQKARGRWAFDLVIHSSVLEADSVILEIEGLARIR
ncbi:16S rRNA (guanine(527)-N(7))-methyltransferase RsmG [Rhizobium paknamense]|uniref:Ribosomal RNA small subunit methyltransferase G n=1 Tax=Rhizobium paknamense TaxID=1206817 RepID=A0ABU0IKJ8_9HYPH|nr:16S rRNA (guanine(527)-N(7))-methyltransferase RsmG [Rhizobium paknamense]MDQ0457940.1 16S rRNA (guanine527-N7)-methyltransferase [Rhizobium paknamense]